MHNILQEQNKACMLKVTNKNEIGFLIPIKLGIFKFSFYLILICFLVPKTLFGSFEGTGGFVKK